MLHILEIIQDTHDNVLLWRGVLQIANEDLQVQIQPGKLKWPRRVLAPKEIQEISKMEKVNCIGAVEKLVEKLLELSKPDWPQLFLKSLEPNFPEVAKALRCLAEKLKADVFTDATLYMDDYGDEEGKTITKAD